MNRWFNIVWFQAGGGLHRQHAQGERQQGGGKGAAVILPGGQGTLDRGHREEGSVHAKAGGTPGCAAA